MASHVVGYPRIGPKRELKFALESFWDKKSSAADLEAVAQELRASIWKQMVDAGVKYIPSNTFSFYDQVLDTTAMLGAVPPRYSWSGEEIGFDTYFSMARGNATLPAMEMTKWFDTNCYYTVPELSPDLQFTHASHKVLNEYKEAKELGIETVPVLIGPVTYLLLSKRAKGVPETFDLLSLLDSILPIYKEVISELKAAGASLVQLDEPSLVLELAAHQLEAFSKAYSYFETATDVRLLLETHFADIPVETYKTIIGLKAISAIGFDFVTGSKTLDLIEQFGFPADKVLYAGIVNGRNIWANDLAKSYRILQNLEGIVGKDKLVVSTSCSLMHTAVDLAKETKLDCEIKSWMAFAAQKLIEVNKLAEALAGQKDEAFFATNAAAQTARKQSPRVTNEEVQKAAEELKTSYHCRAKPVDNRFEQQQKHLNLPILPTTTIGSFPQTVELRRVSCECKINKISEEEYANLIKDETAKIGKLGEDMYNDVLVHGDPEKNDMVEYFGEQLQGFSVTDNGWVQSYGSQCVKPPVIYGDVSRPKAMTVFGYNIVQRMNGGPVKAILTGPVTILNWSFVRSDQPRFETCMQIAMALKDEVEDLEAGGIQIIQIDEPALREGLPLRKSEHADYLDWAARAFRITNCGVRDTTQIQTHVMCHSNINDIIPAIVGMDADVITLGNPNQNIFSVFKGVHCGAGIYDIHRLNNRITEEIANRFREILESSGLKPRKYTKVLPALTFIVAAAKLVHTLLAADATWADRCEALFDFLMKFM